MRIMTDTNIIISAFLFPNSLTRKMLEKIGVQDQLILCSYIIEELYAVFKRKFPEEIDSLDFFLSELAFELVYTPKRINVSDYPDIRDEKDLPILVSAIMGDSMHRDIIPRTNYGFQLKLREIYQICGPKSKCH